MSQERGLRRNVSVSAIGALIFAGTQFALVVMLTVGGSLETGGQYAWSLAITTPAFLLCDLNLRDVQSTAPEYAGVASYGRLRALSIPIAIIASAAIAISMASDSETVWIAVAVIGSKAVESVSDLFYGAFQRFERLDLTARSMALRGVSGTVLAGLGFLIHDKAATAIWMSTLGWLLVAVLHDRLAYQRLAQRSLIDSADTTETARAILRRALPLGIDSSISSLIPNLPRLILESTAGTAALGTIAPFLHLTRIQQLVTGSLGQASISRLAKHHLRGQATAFHNLLRQVVKVACALGVVGLILTAPIGSIVLPAIFGEDFNRPLLLSLLVISTTLLSIRALLGRGIQATNRFGTYLLTDVAALLIAGLASFGLIPPFGLNGLAIAMIVTYGLGATINAVVLRSVAHDRVPIPQERFQQ